MATRHQARVAVISILYAQEMGDKSQEFIDEHLEEKKIRNEQKKWTLELLNGVNDHISELDESINIHLSEYKLDEIPAVERAILRLGAYELKFTSTQAGVIINEAIESVKELGSSPKLVNGVLDAIGKDR